MSRNLDFIKTYFDEIWKNGNKSTNPMKWAETHLSDNFKFLDKDGNPTMDRASYIAFGHLLLSSFRDMKFLYSDIHEEGKDISVTSHWEGTFTGDLDLSALGLGVIPASGRKIVWPETSSRWKIEGEKVVSIQDSSTGGLVEFLTPLGVKVPTA